MPARNLYHDAVKNALVKDGWTITHDPIRLRLRRGKNLFVDLGAERLLAAEKGSEKIAVEIKSFVRASDMKDLEDAVGQFVLYAHLMQRYHPDYVLYLAVPEEVRLIVFEEEAGRCFWKMALSAYSRLILRRRLLFNGWVRAKLLGNASGHC